MDFHWISYRGASPTHSNCGRNLATVTVNLHEILHALLRAGRIGKGNQQPGPQPELWWYYPAIQAPGCSAHPPLALFTMSKVTFRRRRQDCFAVHTFHYLLLIHYDEHTTVSKETVLSLYAGNGMGGNPAEIRTRNLPNKGLDIYRDTSLLISGARRTKTVIITASPRPDAHLSNEDTRVNYTRRSGQTEESTATFTSTKPDDETFNKTSEFIF
jgi:hypothetical protein